MKKILFFLSIFTLIACTNTHRYRYIQDKDGKIEESIIEAQNDSLAYLDALSKYYGEKYINLKMHHDYNSERYKSLSFKLLNYEYYDIADKYSKSIDPEVRQSIENSVKKMVLGDRIINTDEYSENKPSKSILLIDQNTNANTPITSSTSNSSSTSNNYENSSVSKNQVYIASIDFIKEKLNYPSEAKFDDNIVFEPQGANKYIIIGKVASKNGFNVQSDYTYKIWINHNGGHWDEKTSWVAEKIILENISTGKQSIFDNRVKPQNNTTKRKLSSIDGIQCTIYESNDSATRIITSKKMTESQIKKALLIWNLPTNIVYFHLPQKTDRGTEYASKTGDLILVF